MNVLHVSDFIDPALGGGTAERTFQLAMALRRGGQECTVLCADYALGEQRRRALQGVNLVVLPTLFKRFLVPKVSFKQIKELVEKSDIIHITGHWSVLGALVCLFALRLGRPYVYCPAGSLRVFGRSSWLKKVYNRVVGRKMVRGAACCIAVTNLERQQFEEYGVNASEVFLLPNGIHVDDALVPEPQSFRKKHDLGNEQILLFLGRLSPIKGPDLLLNAFARIAQQCPSSRLVFAGPDAELGETLRVAEVSAGLSGRIIFTGFLAGQEKQDALAAADLLVVPSRQEAMSLVALEAGVRGTPVLLTDQCGFDEVQEIDGGLVVGVSEEALAAGIYQLLQSPQRLVEQGERLCERVLSRYTWDGLILQALALYKKLVSERQIPSHRI
ncbi:glycosyltransferase [Pseudomonas sp. MWU12-2319]|uniref:glycosyltransferase n=1 Tax=unclassified Pseudomonas TaxID=196821 RepID=UPI00128D28B0|nr:glycosyltransferase [Pseudomonas sp. MWU12-2323]